MMHKNRFITMIDIPGHLRIRMQDRQGSLNYVQDVADKLQNQKTFTKIEINSKTKSITIRYDSIMNCREKVFSILKNTGIQM